jgi:hypothetical protein
MEKALKGLEGVEDVALDKMLAMGIVSLSDLPLVGVEPLVRDLGVDESLAVRMIEAAGVAVERIAAEAEAAKKAAREQAAAAQAAQAAGAEDQVEADSAGASGSDDDPAADAGAEPSAEPSTDSAEAPSEDLPLATPQDSTPVQGDEVPTDESDQRTGAIESSDLA